LRKVGEKDCRHGRTAAEIGYRGDRWKEVSATFSLEGSQVKVTVQWHANRFARVGALIQYRF
jgi:hypothetical protein